MCIAHNEKSQETKSANKNKIYIPATAFCCKILYPRPTRPQEWRRESITHQQRAARRAPRLTSRAEWLRTPPLALARTRLGAQALAGLRAQGARRVNRKMGAHALCSEPRQRLRS